MRLSCCKQKYVSCTGEGGLVLLFFPGISREIEHKAVSNFRIGSHCAELLHVAFFFSPPAMRREDK